MARRRQVVATPNYKRMLDSYIWKVKTTYDEYKNALIKYLNNTWITDDGSFAFYGANLNSAGAYLIEEKKQAYIKASEELHAFKTLYAEYLND